MEEDEDEDEVMAEEVVMEEEGVAEDVVMAVEAGADERGFPPPKEARNEARASRFFNVGWENDARSEANASKLLFDFSTAGGGGGCCCCC